MNLSLFSLFVFNSLLLAHRFQGKLSAMMENNKKTGEKLSYNETFSYGFGPPYSNSPSKHS